MLLSESIYIPMEHPSIISILMEVGILSHEYSYEKQGFFSMVSFIRPTGQWELS